MAERKIISFSLPGIPTPEPQDWEITHAALARKAAADGIVLLKNDGGMLPLKKGSKIALYGAGAVQTVKGGTGSGDVNERKSVTIAEGLRNAGYSLTTEDWLSQYASLYQAARQAWKGEILRKNAEAGGGGGLDFFIAYSTTPFSLPAGPAVSETDTDTAVYVLSRVAGEGADRQAAPGDYYLSREEHQLLSDICRLYPNVVVILNTGGVMDLSFLEAFPSIRALLYVVQPGMDGGNAVADVLSGAVTPSGKLTDTWAYRYQDYPNAATYSHCNGNVDQELYSEGIYVGYRFFDTFRIPVRYGFGYGLSYTSFALGTPVLSAEPDGSVSVRVEVANAGDRFSGREVVQVYVSLPEGKLDKEYRRLCAFAKTQLLAPGEHQTLTLSFCAQDLASFDEQCSAWILEPGQYGVFVGTSLAESKLAAWLNLQQEAVLAETVPICPLQQELTPLAAGPDLRAGIAPAEADCPVLPYLPFGVQARHISRAPAEAPMDAAEEAVSGLSVEQLVSLSTGDPGKGQGSALGSAGVTVPGSAGETSSCALENGIPSIVLADGPAGLRLNQTCYIQDGKAIPMPFEASLEHGLFWDGPEPAGDRRYQYCTAIPVGTLLAQTWDMALLEEVGAMIGEEMRLFGVHLWLAPGMNIHRNPLCGRNFEYYAEDPLVSGKAAAAITRGVQSVPGCGVTIKHFACNNQEDNRMASDSVLTERTLREIYLRGFGIAVQEADPMAIMTSYNLINGVHAANSYDLCTTAARCEFGFRGLIMTDWTTTEHGPDCTAAGCVLAGNELVMPGQFTDHGSIREALRTGKLSIRQLRASAARIVRVIFRATQGEASSRHGLHGGGRTAPAVLA